MHTISDIEIDQGSDFELQLHLQETNGEAKDLTSSTIVGTIKRTYSSDSSETTQFLVDPLDSTGIATLRLSHTTTDSLTSRKYVYDINLSYSDSDSNVLTERILEGNAYISPSVTR